MATTDALLRAQRNGAQILHNGAPVTYDPRWKGDRKPWVHRGYRYAAHQCQVYWPPADDECIDADGEPRPEHDLGEIECRRCGAEAED